MGKNSKEFKRNTIKLIKLKNRKKENLKFRKRRGIWRIGTNYSKANFGIVFKNIEILRKIVQN